MSDTCWTLQWFAGNHSRQVRISEFMRIGRGPNFEVPLLDDHHVSRTPLELRVERGCPVLDATTSPTPVYFLARRVERLPLHDGIAFVVGKTEFRAFTGEAPPAEPLLSTVAPASLALHLPTRELRDSYGVVLTRFSPSECRALETIVACYPSVVPFARIVGSTGEHFGAEFGARRIVQRIRERLGGYSGIIESAGPNGFRLAVPVSLQDS